MAARASADPLALAAAEEEAVVAVAHLQRRLTLSAVGDGQFRREHFESVVWDHVLASAGHRAAAAGRRGRRSGRAAADRPRRSAVPGAPRAAPRWPRSSPPWTARSSWRCRLRATSRPSARRSTDTAAVDEARTRGEALAAILRAEIEALARDGVVYVALGNPLYTPLLTMAGRARLAGVIDVGAVLAAWWRPTGAVVRGLDVPEHFRVGLDLTDSGPLPTTGQGYDLGCPGHPAGRDPVPPAVRRLPGRPGRTAPASSGSSPAWSSAWGWWTSPPPGRSPWTPCWTGVDPVVDQRGDVDVAIATNSGFAASADQPLMGEPEQYAKLRLVETVARYYWGNEI